MDQLTQETHPMYEIDDPTKLRPYTSLLKHINAKPYNTFDATLVLSPKIKWWQPNFFARFLPNNRLRPTLLRQSRDTS